MTKIKVIHFGLGPIGCAMARLVAKRPNLQIVGAVDIDPNKIGKDLGEIANLGKSIDVKIRASLDEVLKTTTADVVVHTTASYFDIFENQILAILDKKLNIVSTAEELSFPWHHHAEQAECIDNAAKRNGVSVLGTGINPGFLMDSLPLNITALSQEVSSIEIRRAQNASKRRGPFQKKIGASMTKEAFKQAMASGRMGHVGLPESMAMIFAAFGKKLVQYKETIVPVIAKKETSTDFFNVAVGQCLGLRQTAKGIDEAGNVFCKMTFVAYLENKEDRDTIKITGNPDLKVTLEGTNGDIGTAAITINAIKRIVDAPAGLQTMKDLPLVYCG
jgi:2,4-diaminopentanoate dehydrogenase